VDEQPEQLKSTKWPTWCGCEATAAEEHEDANTMWMSNHTAAEEHEVDNTLWISNQSTNSEITKLQYSSQKAFDQGVAPPGELHNRK